MFGKVDPQISKSRETQGVLIDCDNSRVRFEVCEQAAEEKDDEQIFKEFREKNKDMPQRLVDEIRKKCEETREKYKEIGKWI
uniref:Uncharacterized protein n=1 Tax=Ditylenchus dipsaci TaxID=166011 RepID=A0A915EG92_9BILA